MHPNYTAKKATKQTVHMSIIIISPMLLSAEFVNTFFYISSSHCLQKLEFSFLGNTFVSLHLKKSLLNDRVPFGGASKSEVNAPSLRRAFVLLLSGWSNGWFLEENGMMIKHVMLQNTSVV